MTSRGIRNNNPGNIDYNPANKWKGQLPYDPSIEKRFCRFESPECGIRAIMCLLRTYQQKYNLNTISKLIERYAPVKENDVKSYINTVSKTFSVALGMGISPNDEINTEDKKTLITLTKAIIQHENGSQPYDNDTFEKAYSLI